MNKFVALKRFGGGKKLREKYGSGPGRMVVQGTIIMEDDMTEGHCRDLESKGLITRMEKGKKYETQAGKEKRVMEAAKASAKGERGKPKSKAKPEDKKPEAKDEGKKK